MRVLVEKRLEYFWMVQIYDGHNTIRFHIRGSESNANKFAEAARLKFQNCIKELRNLAQEEPDET